MQIQDDWKIEDAVSGLRLSIVKGNRLNRLHVEYLDSPPIATNRDFFFDKEGEFDGTGSGIGGCAAAGEGEG